MRAQQRAVSCAPSTRCSPRARKGARCPITWGRWRTASMTSERGGTLRCSTQGRRSSSPSWRIAASPPAAASRPSARGRPGGGG
eukprot:4774174-Alexandrium_andersonii.AAC.1